ncbi:MAG: sulfite exporter TauE/SafE family protein [Myxococcales bacterium]|nr:sulfite exporter TauE/SafE family protein [Myxococcales bacterium]
MLSVGGVEVGIVWLAALGCSVGLIAGMFGVGGGFLLIPLLHMVLNVPLAIAIGSGLCQTIATALGSLLRYRKLGHAETRLDLLLIGGSIPGVVLGTMLLETLSDMGSVNVGGQGHPSSPSHRERVFPSRLLQCFSHPLVQSPRIDRLKHQARAALPNPHPAHREPPHR